MSNRLARETSPYLLQHQDNPVDWYAWGDEALRRARAEDKPILLSIGYFACHWCHVMEHESFENPNTAQLMNENFICIKVDREERPDLDQIYQNVAQAMTRSGGWPLTVFLTPELKPFFGGTYFPPDDRYGRPGFPRVLSALATAFRNERTAVEDNAARLSEFIERSEETRAGIEGSLTLTRSLFDEAAKRLLDTVDWQEGGFSGAPKFPNVPAFAYLWRYGVAAEAERACEAVLLMLEKIARGGIYDQLGGGFHRYSVDDHWAVPHFEKMLYDNGLLLKLCAEVLLSGEELSAERRALYIDTVAETVTYLLTEMRSPEGLFYAAQDADSDGEEGKFFVWNPDELARRLTVEEAQAFSLRYGVTTLGNFEHGQTVLFQARTLAEVATELGLTKVEVRAQIERARAKLRNVRAARIAPGTDTKALVSWNGLAVSGLCWAAQALAKEGRTKESLEARAAAMHALRTVREKLARPSDEPGRLFSTFQRSGEGGVAKHVGHLEDYAFLAAGAIDAARFAAETPAEIAEFLDQAEACVTVIQNDFVAENLRDPNDPGGFFLTSREQAVVLQRPRSFSDQATPSGASVALGAMAALSALDWKGAGMRYEAGLARQTETFAATAARNPYAASEFLSFALARMQGVITISGEQARDVCRHAQVFRKPPEGADSGLVLCHRQTCLPPFDFAVAAWREAQARLRFGRQHV